jgi:hypothetical protein
MLSPALLRVDDLAVDRGRGDMEEATPPSRPGLAVRRETVIEIVGYAAAAAALTAAGIALGESAGTGVQIAFDVVLTAVLFAAGWALTSDVDIYARMRSIFWFLSVIGVVDLAATLFGDVFDLTNARTLVILTALVGVLYAVALWWLSRRSLQAIALIVLAYLVVLAAVFPTPDLASGVPDVTALALVTLALGLATVFAGLFGILGPRKTTVALGSIAAIVGPLLFLANGHDVLAEVLSLVVAVLLIGAGDVWGERVAAGLGIAGLLIVTAVLVTTNVTGQGAAIAVLVVGLVILGGAILAARQAAPPAAGAAPAATPAGSAPGFAPPGPEGPNAPPAETPPPPPPPPGPPTQG